MLSVIFHKYFLEAQISHKIVLIFTYRMGFLWVTNNIFCYTGYFTKRDVEQRLWKEKIWRTFASESTFADKQLLCVLCFICFQHNSLQRLSLSQICNRTIVLIQKTSINSSDNAMSYIQVIHMQKAYQNIILPLVLIMCIFFIIYICIHSAI